jgi:glycogen(starch) synthase
MRVLMISWEYPPVIQGGLGRHVRRLSEQLAAGGVDVHVLTRGGAEHPAREILHGVTVHRVQEPSFPLDLDRFLHWVQEMNNHMVALGLELTAGATPQLRATSELEVTLEDGFDLVHSHDWLVADAGRRISRERGLPWLVTIHATEHGRHQGWVGKPPQSDIHELEAGMAQEADHLITCSQYMRGHVARVFGVNAPKITVVPNGVDARELEPTDRRELRARFAAPDELLVLLVGRLVHEKGFHLALEALAPIVHRRGKVRFVVAGTGSAEGELKRQAKQLRLGRAGTFLGWVGDDTLHALYRAADLCIVPSIYEPFGIVALEAMASGCVCIVADTGGLREVVPGDGTVGLRFPAGDAGALRVLLGRVLEDESERSRLVAGALEHVLSFSWEQASQTLRLVYDRLTTGIDPRGRRA